MKNKLIALAGIVLVLFFAATTNTSAPEALTASTLFPTANKFTLTTNGLLIQDTNAASDKYRHRLVLRKGQFYTIARAYGNGSFAIALTDGRVVVDRKLRGVQISGNVAQTNAGDSARAVALDLWNQ